jgi:hypothetical protein
LWYLGKRLVKVKMGKIGGLTSSRVFSAIILWNPIPTPSITASKHAHPIAEFLAALYPPLIASAPPVKNPAITVYLSALFTQSQTDICHLASHTSIIWVFLLPYSLHCTIKCREEAAPYSKITP